ncbi:uncharacterized protein METZ01_LOCUS58681 [marine metagenome]|uniref:Uncharacterized protein n=1 Tax=marine metagenome TaxID=408172 RepID=A0A381STT0_9ZZZZ
MLFCKRSTFNPGFDEFLEEVSGIRTVLGTGVYQQIMAWE